MAYAKGHGFVKVEDSMVTVQTKGLGKTRVTVPVSQISGVELKKPTITKGGTFTLRVPGKMGGYIIQFRQGQYSQFVEVQEAIFAAMSSLRGVSAISELSSNAMDKKVVSPRIPVIEAKNETLTPLPSSSLDTPQTSTESTLEDGQQTPVVMNKKSTNSRSKLWLNIFLTIITSGFWLLIWGILIFLRRNPSLSASFHRWYISTELARSRFWLIIDKIPTWVGIPIIFLGAVFREHEATSTLKTDTSLVENFGSVTLVIGLALLALHTYSLVATWQRKRGWAPSLRASAISVIATLVSVTVIFGVLDFPASALRWKIDPSAKVRYLASARQATQDIIDIQNQNKALAAQAALEKQQAEVKKAADARQKIQDETNAKANAEAAEVKAVEDSKNMANGGFTKTEVGELKSFESILYSYVRIWAGLAVGSSTIYEMSLACSTLKDNYQILNKISSKSIYFDDLLDRAKDYYYEAYSTCAHAFEKNRIDELTDSAKAAGTSIAFIKRVLSEMK